MYRVTSLPIALSLFALPLLAGSAPGIKNFDKVDAHVYRGGQPTTEGFRYLAQLGVKSVIDLREPGDRSRAEERVVSEDGMKYISVPMTGLTAPSEQEINSILGVLEDQTTGPVFVHCWRGADRTGAVIGAYHIDHDKWANARALKDALAHRMSFFQIPRQDYLRHFQARPVIAQAANDAPALDLTAAVGH